MIRLQTQADGNAIGDGNTHLGYNTGDGYSHYFRGTGTTHIDTSGGLSVTNALSVSKGSSFGQALTVGSYEDVWRGVTVRRATNGQNYGGRYAVSYVNNMKQSSSSKAVMGYGACIECHNGSESVRRVILCQNSFIPAVDNNTYLGTSSHRWQSVYASSGSVYSSSKDEKDNIMPINDVATFLTKSKTTKEIIRNGIKDTNMYTYTYRALADDQPFVGFLGQELEDQQQDLFNLIGSSYITDDGQKQYDIREASVIGVLWSGLQDALKENDVLKEQQQEMEKRLKDLEDKLNKLVG